MQSLAAIPNLNFSVGKVSRCKEVTFTALIKYMWTNVIFTQNSERVHMFGHGETTMLHNYEFYLTNNSVYLLLYLQPSVSCEIP